MRVSVFCQRLLLVLQNVCFGQSFFCMFGVSKGILGCGVWGACGGVGVGVCFGLGVL